MGVGESQLKFRGKDRESKGNRLGKKIIIQYNIE